MYNRDMLSEKEICLRLNRKTADSSQYTYAVMVTDRILTLLIFASYPISLAVLFMRRDSSLLRCILVPALFLLLVSLFREAFSRKRPFETMADVIPLIAKERPGRSMPSRHVFSAAAVAMVVMKVNPAAGMLALLFAAVLAVCRVCAGVHYISDVLAGFAIGIISGFLL